MALHTTQPRTRRTALALVTVCASIIALAAPAFAQTPYQARPGGTSTQSESFDAVATPAARFSGNEVLVAVGQSLQAAVDAHPAGTHFRIAAGTHRNQQVVPKDGNTFTGEPGAVLSGARVLDRGAFAPRGRTWVLGGQTDSTDMWGQTYAGNERHAAVHDLWLDGQLADHVPSRAAVDAPGEWFYDYDADEIVTADNPTRFRSVELSVTSFAFGGTARDVVIEHLTITRYASDAQRGAIQGDAARDWTIRHSTISHSHGVNVRVGPGFHVHNNRITHAGQMGIGGMDSHDGYQAQLVVEHNEIAHNHTLGYDWGWEAGSTKFVATTGMVFANNWVHHNDGPGPWFDIDNRDAVIRSNLVEHNTLIGIFYEISYGAKIYDNISRYNGSEAYGDLGAGVYISSSRDVEVFNNAIYGNRGSVLAVNGDRGTGAYGRYEVTGLHVHHNDIAEHLISPGLRVEHGDPAHYYTRANNRFVANTYRINAEQLNFWGGVHVNLRDWQAMGQDQGARVLPVGTTPQLPAGSTPFTPAAYGAA